MVKNDSAEFSKLMIGIGELFGSQASSIGLELMFNALERYSMGQIKQAANQILRTRKYTRMPTVADFVEAIEGDQKQIAEDKAETEATKVLDMIRKIGSYETPAFDDPITNDLVNRRFGWQALCTMLESQTSFFVRDFKAAYLASHREESRVAIGMTPELKMLCGKIGNESKNKGVE